MHQSPVRPHVDAMSASAALGAFDLGAEPGDWRICRIARYVDDSLMSACVVEAERDQVTDALLAHIRKVHRRAGRVLGIHSMTSSARARSVGEMLSPSAFAVLRLMISSSLVGTLPANHLARCRSRFYPQSMRYGGSFVKIDSVADQPTVIDMLAVSINS